MAAKQDIAAAAEAHTLSYIASLISPTITTTAERATKMAAHYLPAIALFADGNIDRISDPKVWPTMIAGILDKVDADGGLDVEEKEHRIEVVGERSAIVYINFMRKGAPWTNVYFFRRMESGQEGWEGGNFDGENRMLREMEKKS